MTSSPMILKGGGGSIVSVLKFVFDKLVIMNEW